MQLQEDETISGAPVGKQQHLEQISQQQKHEQLSEQQQPGQVSQQQEPEQKQQSSGSQLPKQTDTAQQSQLKPIKKFKGSKATLEQLALDVAKQALNKIGLDNNAFQAQHRQRHRVNDMCEYLYGLNEAESYLLCVFFQSC